MGSAQSARGIQLGRLLGLGRPGVRGSPRGTSPRLACWPPAGRISSAGGAPRPALGRLGRVRGRRWLSAPAGSFTAPSRLSPRRFPGPWNTDFSAPSRHGSPLLAPPRGVSGCGFVGRRDGAPTLPARLSTGADCTPVRPNRVASPGRGSAHVFQGLPGVCGDVGYPPDPS